jgi:hypothetical protein
MDGTIRYAQCAVCTGATEWAIVKCAKSSESATTTLYNRCSQWCGLVTTRKDTVPDLTNKPVQAGFQSPAILAFIICLILAGCGRPDLAGSEGQSVPLNNPTAPPTYTPTLSALDATKQADDQRWEQELATAEAHPTPITREPIPTDLPSEPLITGISNDCDTVYDQRIAETNCWLETVNGEYVFVVAGAEPNDATQGKLGLYTVTLDETTMSDFFEYPSPGSTGALTITQVISPRITLVSSIGTSYVFNITTRAWESTIPTPTVTPTPVL